MSEDPTERTSLLGAQRGSRVKISSEANSPRTPRPPLLSRASSFLGTFTLLPLSLSLSLACRPMVDSGSC